MAFLRQVLKAIENIDPDQVASPEGEIKEKETAIGPMSDDLKCLHAYRNKLSDEMKELIEKSKAEIDAIAIGDQEIAIAKSEETNTSLKKMEKILTLIDSIFWKDVRSEFPQADDKAIGVREGFQVVTIEEEECNCLTCTLARGFRGIAVGLR